MEGAPKRENDARVVLALAVGPPHNQVSGTTPIKFRINPVRIIVAWSTAREPTTMACGAVATGNIKAHEAARVAGTINNSGATPVLLAVAANTG